MAMFFARAAVPVWVVMLGLAAAFAPAGIATAVFVVALCLICIPAVVSGGLRKRALHEPTADVMKVWHRARRSRPEAIEAEFVSEDVTPAEGKRS